MRKVANVLVYAEDCHHVTKIGQVDADNEVQDVQVLKAVASAEAIECCGAQLSFSTQDTGAEPEVSTQCSSVDASNRSDDEGVTLRPEYWKIVNRRSNEVQALQAEVAMQEVQLRRLLTAGPGEEIPDEVAFQAARLWQGLEGIRSVLNRLQEHVGEEDLDEQVVVLPTVCGACCAGDEQCRNASTKVEEPQRRHLGQLHCCSAASTVMRARNVIEETSSRGARPVAAAMLQRSSRSYGGAVSSQTRLSSGRLDRKLGAATGGVPSVRQPALGPRTCQGGISDPVHMTGAPRASEHSLSPSLADASSRQRSSDRSRAVAPQACVINSGSTAGCYTRSSSRATTPRIKRSKSGGSTSSVAEGSPQAAGALDARPMRSRAGPAVGGARSLSPPSPKRVPRERAAKRGGAGMPPSSWSQHSVVVRTSASGTSALRWGRKENRCDDAATDGSRSVGTGTTSTQGDG